MLFWLVQNGLIYNCFYVIVVCLLICVVLLIGCNYYWVGFGLVCEFFGLYLGYLVVRLCSCVVLLCILCDNGYVIGVFGKWYLILDNVQGVVGLFDNWLLGWGFDYFWGFLSGVVGQYDLIISQDNFVIGIFEGFGEDGCFYYFFDDFIDKVIEWLYIVWVQNVIKLWMLYYVIGVIYVLYYVFKEWVDKY